MYIADKWIDYELLDTSDGERLERWLQNAVKLGRPSTRLRNVGSTRWRIMECVKAKAFFLTFQCAT